MAASNLVDSPMEQVHVLPRSEEGYEALLDVRSYHQSLMRDLSWTGNMIRPVMNTTLVQHPPDIIRQTNKDVVGYCVSQVYIRCIQHPVRSIIRLLQTTHTLYENLFLT